ncbi:MAG: hypothetical protein FD167_201 [bacterium]|nr:MAG: hypothetical protein FD167_201 [bacterium]
MSAIQGSDELNKQFNSLIVKAKEPNSQEHKDLRQFLDAHPELWKNLTVGLEELVLDEMLRLEKSPAFKELFRVKVTTLKNDLGRGDSSPLIKLVIDGVALTYLRWVLAEQKYSTAINSQSSSTFVIKYWSKAVLDSQKVFFRACESLARVKRLSKNCPGLKQDLTSEVIM